MLLDLETLLWLVSHISLTLLLLFLLLLLALVCLCFFLFLIFVLILLRLLERWALLSGSRLGYNG